MALKKCRLKTARDRLRCDMRSNSLLRFQDTAPGQANIHIIFTMKKINLAENYERLFGYKLTDEVP